MEEAPGRARGAVHAVVAAAQLRGHLSRPLVWRCGDRPGRQAAAPAVRQTAQLVGTLEHWQHDSFIVRWDDRSLNADAFVNFALTPDGTVREMRMEPISPLTDFSFDFQDLVLTPVPTQTAVGK